MVFSLLLPEALLLIINNGRHIIISTGTIIVVDVSGFVYLHGGSAQYNGRLYPILYC